MMRFSLGANVLRQIPDADSELSTTVGAVENLIMHHLQTIRSMTDSLWLATFNMDTWHADRVEEGLGNTIARLRELADEAQSLARSAEARMRAGDFLKREGEGA